MMETKRLVWGACGLLVLILIFMLGRLLWPVRVDIDTTGAISDWQHYGRDAGGSRFSPLEQITPENVRHLEAAWTYHHGDVSDGSGEIPSTSAFEATPLLVEGLLVFPTPFNRIIALDPETGDERWTYDPRIDLAGHYANQLTSRGVEYWSDPGAGDGPCRSRIFAATNDARLIALDAATGTPCSGFGDSGQIDLNRGPGEQQWRGEYQVTSPPVAASDLVIVGSAVGDNARIDAPSGVVRAFDARSGELVWAWDLAPPDGPPDNAIYSEAGYLLGTPNVWAPMSVDETRDLLFVPTGNPSPDYYGGLRNGVDFYGSSVVALRASTGEVVWRFQTVHHDLWDFDVPAQPTLSTVIREGKVVPVVIQPTKMGMVFILDRKTGEPVFPVRERLAPQTTVPGEISAPTQPFPVKPPPLVPHSLSAEDAWGLTWIDRGECRELIRNLRSDGIYTPPDLGAGSLMYPGNAGGSNWGGVAVDPHRQLMVANVINMAWTVAMVPRDEVGAERRRHPGSEIGEQAGTPYAMRRDPLLSPLGLPCNPPPWGSVAAVRLGTGDIVWQQPLGTVRDLAPVPIPIRYGVPSLGGPLLTASGLIFIAATMDDYLRAFDVETGEELWKARLPAGGQATPMTFRLREDGRQFVVIAAGGHGRSGTRLGDALVAYALP